MPSKTVLIHVEIHGEPYNVDSIERFYFPTQEEPSVWTFHFKDGTVINCSGNVLVKSREVEVQT
jgi:hypothetical protein